MSPTPPPFLIRPTVSHHPRPESPRPFQPPPRWTPSPSHAKSPPPPFHFNSPRPFFRPIAMVSFFFAP
ncbi:unnamed protein product [Allacma fusca]|uniref:Uncharacterized protein n=1 Tax=Allacma fusca TaxID=39272 RepID=A0A8J2JTU6_9HEXA|nr:unnamed protein product [Allacma fusca]